MKVSTSAAVLHAKIMVHTHLHFLDHVYNDFASTKLTFGTTKTPFCIIKTIISHCK